MQAAEAAHAKELAQPAGRSALAPKVLAALDAVIAADARGGGAGSGGMAAGLSSSALVSKLL